MDIVVKTGRATRPDLHVGICREHEGEPSSIEWYHMIRLNYVSFSTFRIPVARIAAAQAQITHPRTWFYFFDSFLFSLNISKQVDWHYHYNMNCYLTKWMEIIELFYLNNNYSFSCKMICISWYCCCFSLFIIPICISINFTYTIIKTTTNVVIIIVNTCTGKYVVYY